MQTEEGVGGQHQGMDRLGVRQVPEGSGEQRKMEETSCELFCGAPTSLTVKEQMRGRETHLAPVGMTKIHTPYRRNAPRIKCFQFIVNRYIYISICHPGSEAA